MKSFKVAGLLMCFPLICADSVRAQDDETRRAIGLPMMIGQNATNKNLTTLTGKVTVPGLDSRKISSFSVAVYLGGALIDRRIINDSGNYYVPSVPREGVVLSVELGGIEVGRYQLPPSVSGSTRFDITLNIAEIQRVQQVKGVISVENFYPRNSENQKLFDKAMAASKNKNFDSAATYFNQLLKNDPKDFVALTELGTLYFRNEKLQQAEESYIKALAQKPNFPIAQINLGKLYLAQKEPDKAIVVLSEAVEKTPDSADAQHYLGEAYLQLKKGSKAVTYLNEALKLAPIEKAEIHLRLAQLYNGANLKDKAIEEYKQFLAKVPDYKDKDKLEKYIKDNSHK